MQRHPWRGGYNQISSPDQGQGFDLGRRTKQPAATTRTSIDDQGDQFSVEPLPTAAFRLRSELDLSLHAPSESYLDAPQHDVPLYNSEYSGNQGLLTGRTQRPLWTAFWLRNATLMGFLFLFIALAIALIIVWHFATVNNGLSLPVKNHYLWTYGPTAILVVVVGLWRQVDYCCKALVPWQELQNGAPTAARSLLLDYVSPLQITTLVKAVRNKHYAVASSVLGFGLLKLIVVFSNGLLVSSATELFDGSSPITLTTKFDALVWNVTSSLGTNYPYIEPQTVDIFGVSSDPLYAYYGVQRHGMSDPSGTKAGIAFQSFSLGATVRSRNTTQASTEVDFFVPCPTCELTDVTLTSFNTNDFDNETEGGALYIAVDSPSCHIGHNSYAPIWLEKKNPRTQLCEPRELTADIQWVNCSLPTPYKYPPPLYNDSNGDNRWLLTISDIQYSQTFGTPGPNQAFNITSWSRDVKGVTAILCQIKYTMVKMNLTYNFSEAWQSPAVQFPFPESPPVLTNLPGLSNSLLNTAVISTLGSATALLGSGNPYSEESEMEFAGDPLFQLMKTVTGNSDSFEPFLDGKVMSQAAREVFGGIATQFAQQNIIFPSEQNQTGQVFYLEDRLFVRPASFWSMLVGFILLCGLTAVILSTAPVNVTPRAPDSVGALAAIVANSPDVRHILKDSGHLSTTQIKQRLSGHGFRTSCDEGFRLLAVYQYPIRTETTDDSSQLTTMIDWWRPLAARKMILALTLLLPILTITALQIMQEVSDRNKGLFTIENKKGEYAVYYVPTLILLCVATLYNNLDFNIAIYTPFSALRKGNVKAERSLLCFLLGKAPPSSLFEALRRCHPGPVLSTTAGLVGILLPIIMSGIWALDQAVPIPRDVRVRRLDSWDTSWKNSFSNDSGASVLFSLLQYQKLEEPPWTWDELAFPKLDVLPADTVSGLPTTKTTNSSASVEYILTVPALRGSLNCTILSGDGVTLQNSFGPSSHPGAYISSTTLTALAELPPQCLASLHNGQTKVNFSISYYEAGELGAKPGPGSYQGGLFDLHVPSEGYEWYGDYNGNSSPNSDQADNPAGCPSIGFAFGFFRVNHTAMENVTAAICYQNIQEIETEVTFENLPSGRISQSNPPRPLESTMTLLTNGTPGSTAFPYRPQANLADGIEKSGEYDLFSYDPVFDFIINGPGGLPQEDYLGPANADNLYRAINRLYRLYMAQAINLNLRHPTAATITTNHNQSRTDSGSTIFTGQLLLPTPRYKVNAGSRLTLQIMLATMVVLGALAYWVTDMQHTLPHNPCSIAGTMSLLAGSEMCERQNVPEGSEWLDDRGLEGVFSGRRFGLGWWGKGGVEGDGMRFGVDFGKGSGR